MTTSPLISNGCGLPSPHAVLASAVDSWVSSSTTPPKTARGPSGSKRTRRSPKRSPCTGRPATSRSIPSTRRRTRTTGSKRSYILAVWEKALTRFDRSVGKLSPLHIRALVYGDIGITEEVLEREPREAGTVADSAIRDHALLRRYAGLGVEPAQLVSSRDGAGLVANEVNRNMDSVGDVTGASSIRCRARRPEPFAPVLGIRTHIEHHARPVVYRGQDVIARRQHIRILGRKLV